MDFSPLNFKHSICGLLNFFWHSAQPFKLIGPGNWRHAILRKPSSRHSFDLLIRPALTHDVFIKCAVFN